MFVFFFSSRRRHTRCGRDWSSDVCSSDLCPMARWEGPWSNPTMAKKRVVRRRKKTTPKSIGLTPTETRSATDPVVAQLTNQVESNGGTVLTAYREPFGGTAVLLAALPIDQVEPTPFQRDPSLPHVKRLMNVIETLGRFLDPIVAIRQD